MIALTRHQRDTSLARTALTEKRKHSSFYAQSTHCNETSGKVDTLTRLVIIFVFFSYKQLFY